MELTVSEGVRGLGAAPEGSSSDEQKNLSEGGSSHIIIPSLKYRQKVGPIRYRMLTYILSDFFQGETRDLELSLENGLRSELHRLDLQRHVQ